MQGDPDTRGESRQDEEGGAVRAQPEGRAARDDINDLTLDGQKTYLRLRRMYVARSAAGRGDAFLPITPWVARML